MRDRPPWDPRPTSWVHVLFDVVILGALAAARFLVGLWRSDRG